MILSNRSFGRGMISKYLYTRPDIEDYPFAARKLDNLRVTKEGAAESRGGLEFVDECRSPSTRKRLIPFNFSTSTGDTYAIEAGNEYMEFVRAGGRVLEAALTITAVGLTNPCVLTTSAAHGLTAGDHIYVSGIVGTTQLNGRRFLVGTPSTTTLSLQDVHGSNVDALLYTAWSSGGAASRIYKIVTPYQEADLPLLKFTQIADVMYIVHPSYTRRKLSRTGHTSWTLAEASEGPTMTGPTALAVTTGGSGAGYTYEYQVTAIPATGTESLPGVEAAKAISAITAANPAVVTTATHGYSDGQQVLLSGISGMTELNGRRFTVLVTGYSSTTFALVNVDATAYTAYTSGGSSYRTSGIITNANVPTLAAQITLAWTAVAGAVRYAVYKKLYGFYGFVGYAETNAFSEPTYITPDTSQGPPEYSEEFLGDDDQPGAVTAHQNRVVYGGSVNEPDTFKASNINGYDNFSTHNPLNDTDAVEGSLASQEINQIIHLISLRRLIALTGASEFAIEGNDGRTLTATSINARPYTNQGANHVRPAVADNDILFVQARGNTIRSLYYDFGQDAYVGNDLTIRCSDLFRGYSIKDMAYAKIPDSILWACRSDGLMLGLTYNRDERILAWHQHTIGGGGLVENVVSIPENDSEDIGGEDAVYLITNRTVDSRECRYIERMQVRYANETARARYTWTDKQEEFTFLDSFLTYDGRNTASTTMTLSGSGWTSTDTLTLTASASTFASTDVTGSDTAKQYWLYDSDGDLVRCTVTAYTSPTVVSILPDRTVGASLQATAVTAWASAVKRVTGLWHLEGEGVSALGDGFVAANALTDETAVTVADGAAVFTDYYSVLHVGLSYIQDLELLDIEFPDGESLYGKKKKVGSVGVYVKDSRTFLAGSEFPAEGEDVDEGLDEAEAWEPDDQNPDLPPPLRTQHIEVTIGQELTEHGRAVVRNIQPLPLTILAVSRVVEVPE